MWKPTISKTSKSSNLILFEVCLGLIAAYCGIHLQWFFFQKLFQQWATMQHECFHALAAYLTGGHVDRIEINQGGGTAWTSGGFYPVISLAGYMGTSAYAAALLYFGTREKGFWVFAISQAVILSVLAINAYSVGVAWVLIAMSVIMIFLSWRFNTVAVMVFVSGLLFFEGLGDISVLTDNVIVYQTDAALLAKYWGLPFLTKPLAIGHILFTIGIWLVTLWLIVRKILKPTKTSATRLNY